MELYGEDGDTIKLKDPKDEEIKISEIYNGETGNNGSYTENKEKIKQLENEIAQLRGIIEESSKTEEEKAKELANLKATLAQTTATEEKILKGYIAYQGGSLITGTMENRGELNWNPSSSISKVIEPGYYSGGIISTENSYNAGVQQKSIHIPSLDCGVSYWGDQPNVGEAILNVNVDGLTTLKIGSISYKDIKVGVSDSRIVIRGVKNGVSSELYNKLLTTDNEKNLEFDVGGYDTVNIKASGRSLGNKVGHVYINNIVIQ